MTFHADKQGVSDAFTSFSLKVSALKREVTPDLMFDNDDRIKQQRKSRIQKRKGVNPDIDHTKIQDQMKRTLEELKEKGFRNRKN